MVWIRDTGGQITPWICPQLIAAFEDPDSLLPPGFHLFRNTELWPVQEQESLIVFDKSLETSTQHKPKSNSGLMYGFVFQHSQPTLFRHDVYH